MENFLMSPQVLGTISALVTPIFSVCKFWEKRQTLNRLLQKKQKMLTNEEIAQDLAEQATKGDVFHAAELQNEAIQELVVAGLEYQNAVYTAGAGLLIAGFTLLGFFIKTTKNSGSTKVSTKISTVVNPTSMNEHKRVVSRAFNDQSVDAVQIGPVFLGIKKTM